MDEAGSKRWEQLSIQASAWRSARQPDRLAEVGRELVALDPEQELGYRCLADAADFRGDITTAIRQIHEALRRAPEWYWLHYRLGALRMSNGQRPEAERAAREALRLAPEVPDSWTLIARIALAEDDHDGAASALDCALRLDPAHVASLGVSADLVAARGGPVEKELALCRRALEADPESEYAHIRLSSAYLRGGNLDRAEEHAREALRLDPTDAYDRDVLFDILRRRHRLYRWLRAPGRGLVQAWEALAKVPTWAWVLLALARIGFFLLAGLLLASVAWLLFVWPAVTIYQVFVLADVRRQAGVVGRSREGLFGLLRWPMATRMAVFVLLSAVIWFGVGMALMQEGVGRLIGWVAIGGFLLAVLAGWYLMWRDALRRRRRRRALGTLESA